MGEAHNTPAAVAVAATAPGYIPTSVPVYGILYSAGRLIWIAQSITPSFFHLSNHAEKFSGLPQRGIAVEKVKHGIIK